MRTILRTSIAVAAVVFGSMAEQAGAQVVAGPYASSYTVTDLGSVSGVVAPYGGLTLLAGNPNVLLLGGGANTAAGEIFQVNVTRDAGGHIIGFGVATPFAAAPNIDGGLTYAPGGVLFFTGFPSNTLGEIKSGSVAPDRTVSLGVMGVTGSVGSVAFVPAGFTGADRFKILSYSTNDVFDALLSADGSGTYNVFNVTKVATLVGGLEGIAYVPLGSAGFTGENALVSEYGSGGIAAYQVDADGTPILGSRTAFITGLTGAEGALIDPVSGDFLFSTYGGNNRIIRVSGFAAPVTTTPEPASAALMAAGLAGIVAARLRRSNRR